MARNDKEERKGPDLFTLPTARLINSSLFVKDQYDEKSTPTYKIEVAIKKGDPAFEFVFDKLFDAAAAAWPKESDDALQLNIDGGPVISGILDGDRLAAKREAKGKQGDAYKGMWVIRANTSFNKYGEDAAGGIAVYDEEVNEITAANQQAIYPGCYVQVAVSIGNYEDDRSGNHGLKFYLSAVQKVADGERLVSERDHSKMFKPVGRQAAAGASEGEGARRRSRAA